MPNEPLISFNSGELSPLIDARSDIEKYRSGCRIVENMIPRVYGIVERRPGLQYIYGSIDNDVTEKVIPFKDPEQRKAFIDGLHKAGIEN